MFSQWLQSFQGRMVAFVTLVAIGCTWGIREATVASRSANKAVSDLRTESRERRDQTCTISERENKLNVDQLRNTYRYLDNLSKKESRSSLNQFIIKDLPKTEQKARVDVAPEFCDKPGVGLPEPDPKLPKKRDYSHLLVK